MGNKLLAGAVGGGLFVIIASSIIVIATLAGGIGGFFGQPDTTDHREYDIDEIYLEQLPAEGQADPKPQPASRVIIDDAFDGGWQEDEIRALESALVAAGHNTTVVRTPTRLQEELQEDADAVITIDPQTAYNETMAESLQNFTEHGGKLVLVGEPNHVTLQQEGLESGVVQRESEINTLATRFGFSFGTHRLYDTTNNDGVHSNVIVQPTDDGLVAEMDRGVLTVATSVETPAEADVLLQTHETAARADTHSKGTFTVAAKTDNVLALSDADILGGERHNVAGNEIILEAIAEFVSHED